jgi:hypothetical protein
MNRLRIHAAIIRAALWGLIPIGLACWLTRHGGPRRG